MVLNSVSLDALERIVQRGYVTKPRTLPEAVLLNLPVGTKHRLEQLKKPGRPISETMREALFLGLTALEERANPMVEAATKRGRKRVAKARAAEVEPEAAEVENYIAINKEPPETPE